MEELDRSRFVQTVDAYWHAIRHTTARQANAKNRQLNKIVDAWHAQGRAIEALLPLMHDARAQLRLAAAAFLLRYPETQELALAVLQDLEANDPTLVASSAGAVLRVHAAGKMAWQVVDGT